MFDVVAEDRCIGSAEDWHLNEIAAFVGFVSYEEGLQAGLMESSTDVFKMLRHLTSLGAEDLFECQ